MILVFSDSFVSGMSDIIFNRMLVYSSGHIQISQIERFGFRREVIRDKDRMINTINENLHNIKQINESVTVITRAIGNGRSDALVFVGVPYDYEDEDEDMFEYLTESLVAGNPYDYTNKNINNPLVVYEDMAKGLNVEVGDFVRARFQTIYGQTQAQRFTVIAIIKAASAFESMVAYTPLDMLKEAVGYQPHETMALNIVFENLRNPAIVIEQANKLHQALQPELGVIGGEVNIRGRKADALVFGIMTNENAVTAFEENARITGGSFASSVQRNGAMVGRGLANRLNIRVGDSITVGYPLKFQENKTSSFSLKVGGIFESENDILNSAVLANFYDFYINFAEDMPQDVDLEKYETVTSDEFKPFLAREWELLERSPTAEHLQKKLRDLSAARWRGVAVDVNTMYEVANQVLQMEAGLKMISVWVVMLLFFIILIGVVNTLRMSIRERTREIGTIRSIGMQSKDVRRVFVLECTLLSFFASIAGTIAAFILMGIISLIPVAEPGFFGMFMIDNKFHFVPTVGSIISNIIVIILITIATAYFPAKRASKMRVADALRHFE
jgi:ABC-type lipoprotein release transport system permease subunit